MAKLIKPIVFPSIRPPEEQTGFETNVGYEWASRLTLFVQQLTATLDDVINNPASPPGFIKTEDEGTVVNLNCNEMDFVGAGVTATAGGPNKTTVTIPGSPGSGTLQSQEFTASGVFTVPAGVTGVWVSGIGAGSSGITRTGALGGGGGGSGEACEMVPIHTTPAGTITVTIGAKGVGGAAGAGASAGTAGGDTSFGTLVCKGGKVGDSSSGGGAAGGGFTGGAGGAAGAGPNIGVIGLAATPLYFGGGGGGNACTNSVTTAAGAGGGGYAGGVGGAFVTAQGGGGGGSSSRWGSGGAGGAGGSDGSNAASTSYGAGGGGAGGKTASNNKAGDGCDGYVLVVWVA